MSALYKRLKNYHIQQEDKAGCSLASFLMVYNAIKQTRLTQEGFKELLAAKDGDSGILDAWLYNSKRGGMPIAKFIKSLKFFLKTDPYLQELGIKIDKYTVKNLGRHKFKEILTKVSNSVLDDFIIFNYNAHYSPLGKYEDKTIMVLNTDKLKYEEIIRKQGEAEDLFTYDEFYDRLARQNRSILLIGVSSII